jgi:hypothetical protein
MVRRNVISEHLSRYVVYSTLVGEMQNQILCHQVPKYKFILRENVFKECVVRGFYFR